MKYSVTKYIMLLCALCGIITAHGCHEKSKETSSPKLSKAEEVVNRAIQWAGGIEKWNNLTTIDYRKRSRLLVDGEVVEYDITQHHQYSMNPMLQMDIEWTTAGQHQRITHTDTSSIKFLNDSIVGTGKKVKESAMSAFYVLGMPFKLNDPGTQLSYQGQREFNGKLADVIEANYDPEVHENHSTSDQWWYFFGVEDGSFLGSIVYHPPTYALIENIAFHDVEGMKFQKRRMSYRCDSLGNKQFLRAEFWYDDFTLSFKPKGVKAASN